LAKDIGLLLKFPGSLGPGLGEVNATDIARLASHAFGEGDTLVECA
jgi:hypothetical protein